VLLGEAADIDPAARRVKLLDGAEFEYDSLIVATGSKTSYFGNREWPEWAPGLKTVEEATAIRHKILYAFEAAERVTDPGERRAWMTFAIVGAGATGVELAGALAEIAHETLKHDFRSIHPADARILMLDGGPRVLAGYPEDLSRRAEASLVRLGVEVRTGVKVVEVNQGGVSFESAGGVREWQAAKTVLWAGGVTVTTFGRTLAARTHAPTDKQGHIQVLPDLTVPGFPQIYVVGDLAGLNDAHGKPLPGVAQVAMQGGAFAAHAIVKRLAGAQTLAPFHYFDKGDLAVIGRGSAVARIFGLHLSGLVAWLVWLFVHLMYLVQFQSRVVVFVRWGFQYLTFSRGSRLITGNEASDSVTSAAGKNAPEE
jgi:NADH dehydrogenase